MSSELEKLKDIQSIVPIDEYSLYYFIALCGAVLLSACLIMIIATKLYKKIKSRPKKIALNKLKNIDFSNPKKAAYVITKHAKLFYKNSLYDQLIRELEIYKYKKNVPDFSNKSKDLFDSFLKECK
jgi:hypothetical protein